MITLSQLKSILESVEQTTNNPETSIQFNIDHGSTHYADDYKDTVYTIQSVDLSFGLKIDPADPKPADKPKLCCIITLE